MTQELQSFTNFIEEGYVVKYHDDKGQHKNTSKVFMDKAKADAHATKGNSIDKVGGKYTVHKISDKGHEVKEELKGGQVKLDKNKNGKLDADDFKKLRKEEAEQVDEAMSPQQKSDFDRMMAGAMSRAAYNAKWKKPLKSDSKVIYGKNVKEEAEQIEERLKVTHEDPLVTVHDKDGLHTHANLSVANNIFQTKVKHTDVHKGPVKVKSGGSYGNVTFAISKHHAKDVVKEEVEEIEESMTDSWKNVQSMDKGSLTGGKAEVRKRLAYLKAVHDHHKKYGNDTKKVKADIESINRSKIAEEVEEIEEAVKTGNEGRGYHGEHPSDKADAAYSKAHAMVKKAAGEAGHMKDVKKPNEMVKHYLDSQHGRHLKGNENADYIKKDFGKFKKSYKPEHFSEEMTDAQMKKREEIVKSMKKSYKDFVGRYGDRAKEVMYATATKKAMGEETECGCEDDKEMKENAFDWKSGGHKTASSGKFDIKQVGNRTIVTRKYNPETGHSTGTDEPENKEKRGRGRPAGSTSGAKQKGSANKSDYRGIDYKTHSLNLPNSK